MHLHSAMCQWLLLSRLFNKSTFYPHSIYQGLVTQFHWTGIIEVIWVFQELYSVNLFDQGVIIVYQLNYDKLWQLVNYDNSLFLLVN